MPAVDFVMAEKLFTFLNTFQLKIHQQLHLFEEKTIRGLLIGRGEMKCDMKCFKEKFN